MAVQISFKAWLALGIFTVQSGCTALIVRYATSRLEPYSTAVAVFFMETVVKLPISAVLFAIECGGPCRMLRALAADLRGKPAEWLKIAIPSLLYTIQNNLMYVGFANVEAAVGQVTCQSKLLWTAIFSILLLGKRLSPNQWLSLVVLAAGVICVQSPTIGLWLPQDGARDSAMREQSPTTGIIALLVAMVCTSFASVFFEKMLKTAEQPSLWLRNIQMSLYGGLIAALTVVSLRDETIRSEGYLYGFGRWAWLCTIWQGAGGLLVAVTLKHADNILRNFAAGLAIIVAAVGSYAFFEFQFTATFFAGVLLVIGAIFIYGSSAHTPQEFCPSLCGREREREMRTEAAEGAKVSTSASRAERDSRELAESDADDSDDLESTPLRRSRIS